MISTFGLCCWIRFPTEVYMTAISVGFLSPHVGVTVWPPTTDGRGSFLMSIPATSELDAYRCAMVCQALLNLSGPKWSLYHRPLWSLSEQHQPKSSRWQLGMTISPWSVSALTQESETPSGFFPRRSGWAGVFLGSTGCLFSTIHTLNGNRTLLNPCAAMSSARTCRSTRSSPVGTPASSLAPYQFTPASLTRLPFLSTMNRPLVDNGVATAILITPYFTQD